MRRGHGFTLIGTLITIAIIAVLAVLLVPRLTGGRDPLTGKKTAAPKERAQQVAGAAYTGQLNAAIQMYRMDNDGRNPASLMELKRYGATDEMLLDPVTRRPLAYDPRTGRVGASNGPESLGGGANLPSVFK